MPINKSALIRYFIIDECLSSRTKKFHSLKDLKEAFLRRGMNIGERTIERDIYTMINDAILGYMAPIDNLKNRTGYHYTKPGYSIRNLNFTDEQLKSFDFVILQLLEYRDLAVMQEFCGAIEKVIGIFTQMRNSELASCIQYEKVPSYEGLRYRDELLNAILKKELIKVKYTTFKRKKSYTHLIEPYMLNEYKNWWYILGLQHHRKFPMVLALDRIDSITIQEKQFTNTTGFEPSRYFDDFIGVTDTNGPVEKVVLRVTRELANYVLKMAMHKSQTIIEENETHVTIQLNVKDNYELKAAILGHGSGIKVLEPLSLQTEIKQILQQTLDQY